MIINNVPGVVSNPATKSAQPATGGIPFAAALEDKIASATPKMPESDPATPPLQPEPGAVLVTGSGNDLDTLLTEAGEDRHDTKKASDETPFIDPQIQQLQQLMAQTPAVPVDGVTADVQASRSALAETTAVSTSSSGPLAQPFMLNNRKENAAGTANGLTNTTLSGGNTQADLNPGNQEDLFVDKQAGDEKPAELLKPDASASTQPLAKAAEAPQFHSVMMDNLKAVAQPAAAPAPGSGVLNEALGTPAWQQSLGQQVTMFTRNGIHNAELRLHPEDLGAIQINLRMSNEHAQLHFVTENAQVRAALEAAMPHLRSSLAESGIQLGQSSVGADTSHSGGLFSRSEQENTPWANERQGDAVAHADDVPEVHARVINNPLGINTFA